MSLGKGDKPKNRLEKNVAMTTMKTISCKRYFTYTFFYISEYKPYNSAFDPVFNHLSS